MRQYEMFELKFSGNPPKGSEAVIDLSATFTINGKTTEVKGFYEGDNTYIVRFYPRQTGTYTWRVSGVVETTGEEYCETAAGHGMVKAEGTHFIFENGEPYYPVGTTVYALAHQEDELIEQTLASLKRAPFNKMRHCVFPKHYDYNHNDPKYYPFEKKEDGSWDVHHPCYAFWDHLEDIINRMGSIGIESDLILFHPYDCWGFASLPQEDNLVYLDYLLRRFSAIPYIWWSLANEYDIVIGRSMEQWYEIEEFVAGNDPFHHLLSNHNCLKFYDHSRPNITHCSIQSPAMCLADEWIRRYGKPVIYDELEYEGDIEMGWGNISGFEEVNRFWKAFTKGAYATHGETFHSEDEILWWAKGGILKGESPARLAFLKDFFYSLPQAVEAWDEPIFLDFEDETGEKLAAIIKAQQSINEEERVNSSWKDSTYGGHIGGDIYLRYYGEKCPRYISIRLPQDYTYKVEIIDVWDMTRSTVNENASGKTPLTLPGKGGIAVLATRNTAALIS